MAAASRSIRSESQPVTGWVAPWTTKYSEKRRLARAVESPAPATRKVGRKEAVACQVNAPIVDSTVV